MDVPGDEELSAWVAALAPTRVGHVALRLPPVWLLDVDGVLNVARPGWPERAAQAVLADGRRLIWTDDEALPKPGELRDEMTADGLALLIAPHPHRGLRPGDLDRIGAFASLSHRQIAGPGIFTE